MPRELRKRGKRKGKKEIEAETGPPSKQGPPDFIPLENDGEPSWIGASASVDASNLEAPFGYVDSDVQAYFRTVDLKIREWQDEHGPGEWNEQLDVDPIEDRRLFLTAALSEMSGKELQLATDPNCSVVLERMAHSMSDFSRRVFMDCLAGSYEKLVTHRFASHVCQTLFTLSAKTVSREMRGINTSADDDSSHGTLRTMSELVLSACEELLPSLPTLIMDTFASHVIRAILLLISSRSPATSTTTLRSKKSAAYKASQGAMTSVLEKEGNTATQMPKEFAQMAHRFVQKLRKELGENEIRALAGNKVASPVLQLLLELETEAGGANEPGSLMDNVLVGLITELHSNPTATYTTSPYLETLLRDPTASHLLETVVTCAPEQAFSALWSTYFSGRLGKLASHPVANFVVAKAVERVNKDELRSVIKEMDGGWEKLIKSSRTGVLKAAIDRAAALNAYENEVVEAICTAFELPDVESRNSLLSCILVLKPLSAYNKATESTKVKGAQEEEGNEEVKSKEKSRGRRKVEEDPLAPTTQGALLLQSMLRLSGPHGEPVLNSLASLKIEEVIALAHHSTSSRVLDVVLESSTVAPRAKRRLITSFIGHFHTLVDDRIGSRVGDRCWDAADPYLRERIARSLIDHEMFLAGSFYGKFFARNLHLMLLKRRPDEWKQNQVKAKLVKADNVGAPPISTSAAPNHALQESGKQSLSSPPSPEKKRKRGEKPQNEIDQLFATAPKKLRKGETRAPAADGRQGAVFPPTKPKTVSSVEDDKAVSGGAMDEEMSRILGAIKAVPKGQALAGKSKTKKKRK
ncbi:hypothetical protein BOTBODRAFT_169367 [Botryobasidium botryosum FD-172 SS1]|uniref:Nucleolar protein 9 n=1 Tax=Botryobasidium botryosum (strain FD-172 SS1) TaxID=930990 RepID=A0A067NA14_BOTB1|nr:hypothetical protein BOTBODRAFT_169367 [Botryobasidium botryosum FD-172 SS1]